MAALRALAVREKTLQEQDAAEYDAACAERKKKTRAHWLRGKERAAEVKVLRHEMFKSGFSMIQRHLTMWRDLYAPHGTHTHTHSLTHARTHARTRARAHTHVCVCVRAHLTKVFAGAGTTGTGT